MATITWKSVYCRIPAGQHRKATQIAKREYGGKTGRYLAALIDADLKAREAQKAK